MRKILILAATVLVPVFGNAVVLADTNSSNLNLTIDTQQSTSSAGDSTTVVSSTSQQINISATIQNFAFSHGTMAVPQGTTVTWTNNDNTAHTVTGDTSNGPASSLIQPGQSYSFTFSSPGTFKYHCSIHPEMTGTVTVTATSSSGSTSSQSSDSSSSAQQTGNLDTSSTSSNTANASDGSSAYTSTAAPSSSSEATLPSTGPTSVVMLFIVSTLLGSGLYYLRLTQRRQRST